VVKDFFAENKLSFMALLDSDEKARNLFGVGTIPTFIVDNEGRIISSAAGPRKWDSKESFALFEHLVKFGKGGSRSCVLRDLPADFEHTQASPENDDYFHLPMSPSHNSASHQPLPRHACS
jgi:hypothetical protein